MGCIIKRPENVGFFSFRKAKNINNSAVSSTRNFCSLILDAPTLLILSNVTSTTIQLDWTTNSDGEETGFGIERSLDDISFTQIATVASGVVTFTDTLLDSNTEFFYRVNALGPIPSSYTDTVSATTLFATPLDLFGQANIHAWFRSDDIIFNGDNVSQWTDKSGNGRHIIQVTAGDQPFHNSKQSTSNGSLDSHDSLYWFRTGADQRFMIDNGSWAGLGTGPYFAVIIWYRNMSGNDIRPMYSRNDAGDGNQTSVHHSLLNGGSTDIDFRSVQRGIAEYSIAPVVDGFLCEVGKYSNNTHRLWKNGVEQTITTDIDGTVTELFNSLILGGQFPDGTGQSAGNRLFEIFFINGNPEDYGLAGGDAINKLHSDYLADRYPTLGIVSPSLP